MMDFGSFIYGIGLIDRAAADYMLRVARDAVAMVRAGNTVESGLIMDRLFFGILTHETFFKNVTGFDYYYNYLTDTEARRQQGVQGIRPEARGQARPAPATWTSACPRRTPRSSWPTWPGRTRTGWSHAPRHIWRSADGKRLYGYKKTVENLNFVVVRNGGHVLPYDQPEAMFELITAFIDNEPPFSAQATSTA
ncbi:hypothetical protein MRX96_036261 [Rhipicephalus microplus]